MSNLEPIIKLETQLGLPDGFYQKLLNEDDWSFIIKIHSLLEAAITHLLTETVNIAMSEFSSDFLDRDKLEKNFSWLEMSNKSIGKVTLSNSLGMILEESKIFIINLSELRNKLVHKISNMNFSFENHLNNLDKLQKRKFVQINRFGIDSSKFKSESYRDKFILTKPKLTFWLNGMYCLSEINYCIETFQLKNENKKLKDTKFKDFNQFLEYVLKQK